MRQMNRLIFAVVAVLAPVFAQTQPVPTQVKWPTAAEPMLTVILPTGIAFIKLDPLTLEFDAATMTLKAKPQAPKVVVYSREVVLTVAGKVNVPTGCGFMAVYRNGVLQNDVAIPPTLVDYTVAGSVLTFLPTSLPQTGDVMTVQCAR